MLTFEWGGERGTMECRCRCHVTAADNGVYLKIGMKIDCIVKAY